MSMSLLEVRVPALPQPEPPSAEMQGLFQAARVLGFEALPEDKRAAIGEWAVAPWRSSFAGLPLHPSALRSMEYAISSTLWPHLPYVYATCEVVGPRVITVKLHERTP